MHALHDYQREGHEKAVRTIRSGGKALYVAPTGSGKSYVQAANHEALYGDGLVTVAPSTEIVLGIARRCSWWNDEVTYWSEPRQQAYCEAGGLWTVMRLHNALLACRIDPPRAVQFDEGHHTTASSYETLHALCGDCPAIAYTATGFRGTPEETRRLREKWGEPVVLLTLKSAVDRGIIARPDMRVWPLLNDETIKVTGGEFETKAVESELKDVAEELCQRIKSQLCEDTDEWTRMPGQPTALGYFLQRPRRPTMVTAPGVASARHLATLLARDNRVACVLITGDTCEWIGPNTTLPLTRQDAFHRVTNCEAILVQVNVVGEGVDLPIRVQVDTAPTMSPVRWMQRVGRGTRPTEETPLYICTNHNIARHAYLWAGVLPNAIVRDAQQAWGPDFKPSRRLLARAIGLEGFGRFKVAKIPMRDGTYASLYALQTPNGTHQYAVFLHACLPDLMFFVRENPHNGKMGSHELPDGRVVQYKLKDYGPWKKATTIPDMDGYVSTKSGPVTEKMLRFWKSAAGGRGLDENHVPNWHEFQALPALLDTRTRFTE